MSTSRQEWLKLGDDFLVTRDLDDLDVWDKRGTTTAGCSKRPLISPAQPRRLFHPPALSLPSSLFTLGHAFSQAGRSE